MPVGPTQMLELVRRLVTSEGVERGMAADSVTDWLRSYDATEGEFLAQLLVWLAELEVDESAFEAEMHALAELADRGQVPPQVVEQVKALPGERMTGSSHEYFMYLTTESDN